MDNRDQLSDSQKKQMVVDAWLKGNKAQTEIIKDHADRQELYSREVRDFFKFQLSLTPIILSFILSVGINTVKNSFSLSVAVFLLIVHFIWGLIYYFTIINHLPISLYASYKRIKDEHEEQLKLERKYLLGQENIQFDDVMKSWNLMINNNTKSEKEPDKIIIDMQMKILLAIYLIAILMIAITLINWPIFASYLDRIS